MAAGVGILGTLAAAVAFWPPPSARPDSDAILAQARIALERREYALAETLAGHIERDDPSWPAGRLVAGEAATKAARFEDALDHYAAIPRDGSEEAVLAAFSAGEVARHIGWLSEAERAYSYVLEHRPDYGPAHERMAFLLGMTGRRWESLPHFLFLIKNGTAGVYELALLGDLERPMEQAEYLRRCAKAAPNDVLVRLGLAANAVSEGETTEARRLLKGIVAEAPELVAAQATLGELLVDTPSATFASWHSELPPAADAYADIWFVRGLWARRRNDLRVAARCFWEAIHLAPAHRRANYQMGQVLISLGESSGQAFAERAGLLYELTQNLDVVLRSEGQSEAALKKACELTEATGRIWEAYAWAATAAASFPSSAWPHAALDRLSPRLTENTPHTLASADLSREYDYSGFPDCQRLLADVNRENPARPRPKAAASILFEEEQDVGIDFVYDNGADPATAGARMFEQTGGGAAVLDYDGDRWPDLYFTQGAKWESGATEPTTSPDLIDRLYRNAGGRSFIDVTHSAGLGDPGFGQGAAAADFDGDGFQDLYVANVGRNRLYRNNGDGTFTEVTDSAGLEGETWTASCVVADLNADGHPDLFDVTYLTGPGVYTALCDGRACSPKVFEGASDRLHLSRGDGTFEFVPNATPTEHSKGLGVVAADLDIHGRPSLFISNDQVPNHFLRNVPSDDPSNIRLQEEGFYSGLAFNEDGLPMACMGIAAGDADGNGLLDFYVTNFKDESNTLYLQDAPGLFVDATNPAGLRSPSLPMVGWGTQFLDADLDGEPDLVVVNGHIDDYRDVGGEFHMRPQFFRNTGRGRFVELFADEAGGYFGRKHLGRGLARLDWNRDGRMDFVVSNIGERASLLTNESTDVGHFVNVRLHARNTARDAIGSVVTVTAGGRHWTKQLVAGDGLMATNERMLQFGLGRSESVAELHIEWPSGVTTTFRDMPADTTIEANEGSPHATLWRGTTPESIAVH